MVSTSEFILPFQVENVPVFVNNSPVLKTITRYSGYLQRQSGYWYSNTAGNCSSSGGPTQSLCIDPTPEGLNAASLYWFARNISSGSSSINVYDPGDIGAVNYMPHSLSTMTSGPATYLINKTNLVSYFTESGKDYRWKKILPNGKYDFTDMFKIIYN
jgi:hypothetical protein